MGGKGSGGSRSGAGRPTRLSAVPSSGRNNEKPAEPVAAAPPTASASFQAIWDDLAPKATAEGTLVESTRSEFRLMVELAVEHQRCHKAVTEASSGQDSYLALLRIYMPLTQRLEAKMRAFRLAPMGKPIATKEDKPKSALDRLKEQRKSLHAVK